MKQNPNHDGKILIFRPYITMPDGSRRFPKKGRVFPLWVDPT